MSLVHTSVLRTGFCAFSLVGSAILGQHIRQICDEFGFYLRLLFRFQDSGLGSDRQNATTTKPSFGFSGG